VRRDVAAVRKDRLGDVARGKPSRCGNNRIETLEAIELAFASRFEDAVGVENDGVARF
jgi:hypothetical protein